MTSLALSKCTTRVLVLGLTREYLQVLKMVEWATQKTIFTKIFAHSLPYRIRQVQFLDSKVSQFVTVGIQHIQFWKVCGEHLEYHNGMLFVTKR